MADFNLWSLILPIVLSVILSLTGAIAIAKYAGPAQAAYVKALEGRVSIVTQERDDAMREIPLLRARVGELEREVEQLKSASGAKDREIADLYRRLDADEAAQRRRDRSHG